MINLPKNPKIQDIPVAVKQLVDIGFQFEKLIDNSLLSKINHDQFIFLIGISAHEGKNFNKNMSFIKKYIEKIKTSEIELLLQLEIRLHNIFLKKYEREFNYNIFYKFFSGVYSNQITRNIKIKSELLNKIIFYVHSPSFLAHTNPLFHMLGNRKNDNINVSIAANGFNKEFKKKCDSLEITFYDISDKNLLSTFNNLSKIAENYDRVIWQSVPVHLSYFRTISENICLWSSKFHPNINGLQKYIGTFNETNKKKVLFNNNCWENINIGFEVKNIIEKESNWEERELKFGAFCRVELIDDVQYWENIKLILEEVPGSKFFYCGKYEIHSKFCLKLNIDPNRIEFLGWLKKPNLKLKEMAFILDGYSLGHGLMAVEAMAVAIPIVFPKNRKTHGTSENFLKKSCEYFQVSNKKKYYEDYLLAFENKNQLVDLSKKLLTENKFNYYYGFHYKKVVQNYPNDTFESFVEILK